MCADRCFSNPNKFETSSDYTRSTKQKTIYSDIVNQVQSQTNFIKTNGLNYNQNFGLHNNCLTFAKSYDLLLDVTKGNYYTNPVEDSDWVNNETWSNGLYSVDYSVNNVKTVVDTSYNAGNANQIIFPMTQSAEAADMNWNGSYPGVRVDPSYNIFYNECGNQNYWKEKLVNMSFNTTNYYKQSKEKSEQLYGMVYPSNVSFGSYNPIIVYAATQGVLSISTDGGKTFVYRNLGNFLVRGVYAVGSTVYVATEGGVSISTNGGTSFGNRTIDDGLGSNYVYGVYAVGSTVYAATEGGGLSISTNGGTSFENRTPYNSNLGDDYVYGVYAVGSTVYAATFGGLSISTNGGQTFENRTVYNGLGSNNVYGVYAVGSTVYAATIGDGLSISTDGGQTFGNRTIDDGLGSNSVKGVYAVGSTVYAATFRGGLSISTDGGQTFENRTVYNGLGSNDVYGVYAVGSTVYAATFGGLSISTNGGQTFENRTVYNGLGSNNVTGVYAVY